MADPVDLSAARWEQAENATDVAPQDAIRAVLRDLEKAAMAPKHVIVLLAFEEDGRHITRCYQAGKFGIHGQLGLLVRGQQLLSE